MPDRDLTGRNENEEMSEPSAPTMDMAWAETASRLLELQQKLDAWNRLYNGELSALQKALS
jgi:hypothetical protein